jgi:hypothetical protein
MFIPDLAFVTISNVTATSPQLDLKDEGWGFIIASTAVGLLVLLVLVSTAVTVAGQPRRLELPRHEQLLGDTSHQGPKHPLAIEAFSLVGKSGTLRKLLEIPSYKPTDSLNGLRVLSMGWIILGHTFLMPEGISGYRNQEDIVGNPLNTDVAERNPLLMIIVSAQSGVDTFSSSLDSCFRI